MSTRTLVWIAVVAGSIGCSSADPGVGYGLPGTSGGTDAGSSVGASSGGGSGGGSGSGGGVTPPVGTGGDASTGTPSPSDAGPKHSPDGAAPGSDAAASAPDASLPNDGFDQFQHRNLDDINKFRATLSLKPLVLDKQLSTFAAAGSLELSQDHTPHQHFINASNDGSIWTSGFNSTAAENQGDPNGWTKLATDPTQNELQQIDAIQQAMFDEGPGTGEAHGHYENMMSTTSTRVGVGLLDVNGMLYLTNDFSQ